MGRFGLNKKFNMNSFAIETISHQKSEKSFILGFGIYRQTTSASEQYLTQKKNTRANWPHWSLSSTLSFAEVDKTFAWVDLLKLGIEA